ncbi:MAG: DUF6048 family protein [Bacteroidota bacterium]
MKLLFNIALLLFSTSILAQESLYSIPIDSIEKNKQYIPTGIRVGVDILGPILHQFDKRKLSYELTLDTDIDKYGLVVEAGYQQFNEVNDNVDYAMKGTFLRIGPEANFLHMSKDLNNFFFGLRYAWSSFDETIVGTVEDDIWGSIPVDFDVKNNTSRWFEMNTGLRIRLWKGLFTGYTLRFRFGRGGSVPDVPFSPYYIPGYGLAQYKSTWDFRYYVLYRIQWSKKPILSKRKEEKKKSQVNKESEN